MLFRSQAEEEIEMNDDFKAFEEKMYGDVWNKEDYLNWMYENLLAIKSIMSETASIYVHLDWHIGHYVKILMDEIFGADNFINEIAAKLDELLSKLDPKERIDFLQNSRYRLKDELLAFSEGEKYQSLIQDIHSDKICYKIEAMKYSDYNFEMKIDILEEKLAKELKDYRNK